MNTVLVTELADHTLLRYANAPHITAYFVYYNSRVVVGARDLADYAKRPGAVTQFDFGNVEALHDGQWKKVEK